MEPLYKRKIDPEELINKGYPIIQVYFDKNGETTRVEVYNRQNFHITDSMIKELARCLLPDVIEFYSTQEGRDQFNAWKAEQK